MIHLNIVLVFALFLCSNARDVGDILHDLQKYCPFYAFDGKLYCPTQPHNASPKIGINLPQNSTVLSGLGYDSVTRQIRFPVLPSSAMAAASSQSVQTYVYTDVSLFLSMVFAQKTSYEGGLFILDDSFVTHFASLFTDYRVYMTVTQKQYNSYATKIISNVIIPEFQELLDTLPTVYDPNNPTTVNMYQERIINIFGTHVTVSSTHGGIFYQQSVVKACYGGDYITNMVQEITSTIAKLPPGPLAYLHYRSLGIFDVKGGNPEIPHGEYAQIIASFPQAPAITSFESVPLWQVVPANYQAAVKAAIDHYMQGHQVSLNTVINQIEAQKLASFKNPQSIYVYGQQTEQFAKEYIHWPNCPFVKEGGNYYTPRCSYPIQTTSVNSGQVSVIPGILNGLMSHLYESQRDIGTGDMRIFSNTYDNNVLVYSNATAWQHTGCVNMVSFYLKVGANLSVTSCMDCLPVVVTSPARYGLVHTDLQCVCPGF